MFISYIWRFNSPAGDEFSLNQFQEYFSQSVKSGGGSQTLTIKNVPENMNGWGAYCVCTGNGQTARSSTAYVNVSSTPIGGTIAGTVTEHLMSTVTIGLNNGQSVQVLKDICSVSGGSIDYGCYCICYYSVCATPAAHGTGREARAA